MASTLPLRPLRTALPSITLALQRVVALIRALPPETLPTAAQPEAALRMLAADHLLASALALTAPKGPLAVARFADLVLAVACDLDRAEGEIASFAHDVSRLP